MTAAYVMVGGFLGAGKTTAMLRLAEYLTAGGRRVGLITNDQSHGLVDTAIVASRGFPVEEITGGCFCCRFNSLTEAAERLAREARPDVFLAEPVGSCTDLRATVQYPLRRLYGDHYTIAPLSVLVDPMRAMRVLGLQSGGNFSPKVLYVYAKQLEEADILVINKTDLLSEAQRVALQRALRERYPAAEVLAASARTGDGLDEWFERLFTTTAAARPAMEVDYDLYAGGEALLAWLNATVHLAASDPFDGNHFVQHLAGEIRRTLAASSVEIAHLKMTLSPENGTDLAVLNLVRTDGVAELPHRLTDDLRHGELIVNLRGEGDPDGLREALRSALATASPAAGVRATIEHCEHFRPGRPEPTHRLVSL